MDPPTIRRYRTPLTIAFLILLCVFVYVIRILPFFSMGSTDPLTYVEPIDSFYNLRQTESLIANFPNYAWYDPMSQFMVGEIIYWGPLTIFVYAIAAIAAGATTRPEIIRVAMLVAPLFAVAMVPLMYYFGKAVGDWKTGLLSALFIAVIPGQFLVRSYFGYIDHHIAETLFSTLFLLMYILALEVMKQDPVDLTNFRTLKKPALIAAATGIAYLLCMMTIATMVFFALIIGVFTLIQCIVDFYFGRSSRYFAVLNGIAFGVVIVGLILFGFKKSAMSLTYYTVGQVAVCAMLIAGTVLLVVITVFLRNRDAPKWQFPLLISASGVLFGAVLYLASPYFFSLMVSSLSVFFDQNPLSNTIPEAQGWTLAGAWMAFSFGLILMAGGALLLAMRYIRNPDPKEILILVWSAIVFFLTWQHMRYEYYLAVNVALLSALIVSWSIENGVHQIPGRLSTMVFSGTPSYEKTHGFLSSGDTREGWDYRRMSVTVIICLLAILFIGSSLIATAAFARSGTEHPDPAWLESLAWLAGNSPDPGIDYYGLYEFRTYTYPAEAYSVMAWADYGHLITYIPKRSAVSNPFQRGILGTNGSAAYFMTESEDDANRILDSLQTRYVITDVTMTGGRFPIMATWYNSTSGAAPYIAQGHSPTSPRPEPAYSHHYSLTMVTRLQNYDGTLSPANPAGFQQDETIPALHHYRLIHESPVRTPDEFAAGAGQVKIFEYVPGARIHGEGIIEVPVITNTGRTFIYRQASRDGKFIVPYATTGSPPGTRTLGKYRIAGTSIEYEVPEDAVVKGGIVNFSGPAGG